MRIKKVAADAAFEKIASKTRASWQRCGWFAGDVSVLSALFLLGIKKRLCAWVSLLVVLVQK